ncbi:MAG: 3-oxoacid CoA-transferase [Ardenticatenales bacterium]|jgi:glutaconate CoA-transferase subunit B|nr:3-oxoacid CoA-transferase [Ardenticatenales bacterium]
MTEYSSTELLICIAARVFENGKTCFIGTGVPMLAASLAQRLYAPDLVAIFEFGGTGAQLEDLPMAVGEARTFHKALAASGICDIMETAQRGFIDYGFLGGAQIDPYGNLNSTVIGDHGSPKVRLPGSGGGNDVGSLCWQTIALMRHDKRRFVPQVDFVTTPGFLTGPGAREAAGLPVNTGPIAVISTLATMGFDSDTCRMQLEALHPGVTLEQALDNTGFELLLPTEVKRNAHPTAEELRVLRDEIDPTGLYI